MVNTTPSAVAGLIPSFSSTCLFHVVPWIPGYAADEKTVPDVLYNRKKPLFIASIENVDMIAII